MKKEIYIIALLLIELISCNDNFLDRIPYDSISSLTAYSTDEKATMSINGIYNALNQQYTLMGFPYIFTNIGPDGFGWSRDGQIEQGLATTKHATFLNVYTQLYKVIRLANLGIANLSNNPTVSQDLSNRLLGEAKFMRGIAYFYLWQLYGEVVILDKPVSPSETYLPRNSADEVKQLVINDFEDAIPNLPVSYSSSDRGRITQGAAIAMLGKTYLYDKQWSKAAQEFQKLMVAPFNYGLVDDYAHLFNYKWENNSEVVFSMQEIMVLNYGGDYDMWYGGRSIITSGQSYSQPSYNIVTSYTNKDGSQIDMSTMPKLSQFNNNDYNLGLQLIPWYQTTFAESDDRLNKIIIMPGATYDGINPNTLAPLTFKVYWPYAQHANDNPPAYRTQWIEKAFFSWRKYVSVGLENIERWDAPHDINIIRYSDVLLMYAEAKNESEGPSNEVYDAINRVRNRAGVTNLSSNLSKDELRRYIWLERFHEFPGEGILFFDVRRWKTAATNDPIFGLNHDILDFRGEKAVYKRAFAEKDYLWPIPQSEMDINKQLTQNPGW